MNDMKPGPELDALVAKAMGIDVARDRNGRPYDAGYIHVGCAVARISPYSTDDAAALELADRLLATGGAGSLILHTLSNFVSASFITEENVHRGKAATRPHAVCLAVLELIEAKERS